MRRCSTHTDAAAVTASGRALVSGSTLAHEAPMMPVWIVCLERLAGSQGNVVLRAEGETSKRRKEHDDAPVHDVAAIAAPVAGDESHEANRDAVSMNGA